MTRLCLALACVIFGTQVCSAQVLYEHSAYIPGEFDPDTSNIEYHGNTVVLKGDRLVIGSADSLEFQTPGSVTVYDISEPAMPLELYRIDQPGSFLAGSFGDAVALSGDTMLIGAPGRQNEQGFFEGALYSYELSSGQFLSEIPPTNLAGSVGYGFAVAADGEFAAVGSPGNNRVYLYDIADPTGLIELNQIVPPGVTVLGPDGLPGRAGWSLALEGDMLVIGAPWQEGVDVNGDPTVPGAVYVYDVSAPSTPVLLHTWQPQPSIFSNRDQARFGWSVDISGDNIIVGAPGDSLGLTAIGTGTAAVYSLTTGALLETYYPLGGIAVGDSYGSAVSLVGDLGIVGARDTGFLALGEKVGKAYLIDLNDGQRTEAGELVNPEFDAPIITSDFLFGASVDFDGSIAAVGAPGDPVGISLFTGAAYVFELFDGPCLADTNNDGTLSPADFTAWINAFNNNLPECDQNVDGACTPTDFTAWIANYNAGCP